MTDMTVCNPPLSRLRRPLYWLRVPADVMMHLRLRSFHDGHWRDPQTDVDRLVQRAFEESCNLSLRHELLEQWISYVDRETASIRSAVTALWNPMITDDDRGFLSDLFKERLVEVAATTVEEALHQVRLSKWTFAIFYHVACMGNWREVVTEQIAVLRESGLNGVNVTFLGDQRELSDFLEVCRKLELDVEIKFWHSDLKMYEVPAMRLIEDWASANDEAYMLYLHTKGVSQPHDALKVHWRRLMTKWVVKEWRRNAEMLRASHDVIGVNWRDCPPISHFPGNFYMAKASFIRKLKPFADYYRNPPFSSDQVWRLAAEFWLGSSKERPRMHSHVSWNERIDYPEYWRDPARVVCV